MPPEKVVFSKFFQLKFNAVLLTITSYHEISRYYSVSSQDCLMISQSHDIEMKSYDI